MSDTDVFIVSALRSAIALGKESGALYPLAPVDLASKVMAETIRRAGIDPKRLDDVIWGVVTPIGDQGANLARLATLNATFPMSPLSASIVCADQASRLFTLPRKPFSRATPILFWQAVQK